MVVVLIEVANPRTSWDGKRELRVSTVELTYTMHREWAAPKTIMLRIDTIEMETSP